MPRVTHIKCVEIRRRPNWTRIALIAQPTKRNIEWLGQLRRLWQP